MNDSPYTDRGGRVYGFGEFFPPELSPFAFNESAAYTYTPIKKAEIINRGWRWKEIEQKEYKSTLPAEELPNDIQEVSDAITHEVIACEHAGSCDQQCTKAFRIIPSELAFYKARRIALPRLCPNCRHYERVAMMPDFRLYTRMCMCVGANTATTYQNKSTHAHGDNPCSNKFETSYSPDRPEIVYCEHCYQAEIA